MLPQQHASITRSMDRQKYRLRAHAPAGSVINNAATKAMMRVRLGTIDVLGQT
jgi:hypothetical protein